MGRTRSLWGCADRAQSRTKLTSRRCKAVVLAALGAVIAAPVAVHATVYSWNINASGLFDTAANWAPSGPPTSSLDTANFDQTGTYTVTFQNNRTNSAFTLGNGNVT